MDAVCAKCGLTATLTLRRRDIYELKRPTNFHARCPVVAARLKEKGHLDAHEHDCPYLARAASLAFDEWRRRGPF